MPATSILLKFKVHSLTDTYHAVGTSVQGSFNKELGRGRDLIVGGGVVTEDDLKLGVGIETQISLDGKYGEFTIRVYAENELGLRSKYVEVVKQVLGPSVDGTYSFGDVHVAAGEVVSREFVGSDTYDIGNTTKVNLDFRGASPNLNWSLLAPPGHALEGNQLDSSMVKEDGFFDKFVISFWRPNGSGDYDILDSDDEVKMIDDIFGDILEDMGSGKWQSQTFFLNFPESSSTNFSGLAGGSNKRKLLIKIEAHAIKFNANDPDKISHLEVILENSKTKLKTNFVETVANDFIFSYEAQDVDLSRVEVLQYREKTAGNFELVKTFGGPSDSGASRVQLGTIKAQQKWSNGRGSDGITPLVNIYKYVIAVYDSFGLSSAYAPKADGSFQEEDSIADALAASNRTFQSIVKIGDVTIADVADKFNISWSLVDARGNGISFDNDSNSDFASVVSGVVGYFHRENDSQGTHEVVDAFKVKDVDGGGFEAGDRFTNKLTSLDISELKQEYGVTLIPNISKDENKRIQELLGVGSEASRSIYFTLKLLDSRGEVIDELEVSGTNEQPQILDSGESLKYHPADPVGSIRFDFKFNENIEYIKMFRKPRLHPAGNNIRYAQRSTRVNVAAPFGLTTNTPWAAKYNTEGSGWFGHYSGNTAGEAKTYAESMAVAEYWVSDQKLSDPNSTETDTGKSSATIIDKDVPLVQRSTDGFSEEVTTDITTLYDYVIVPYDTFGAGVPYLIPGVEVIAYQVATKDDEGFVGFLDVIPPQKPENFTVKTSFNTFFLEWDPAPAGNKVVAYKVTMVRDSRPLKDRSGAKLIEDSDGLMYKGADQQGNVSFNKWIQSLNNSSWAAVSTESGAVSKAGVVENPNDAGIIRTRSKNTDGSHEFTKIDGHLYISDDGKKMYKHNASGSEETFDDKLTVEEYIVETTSLAIEGEKNQTGYFFIEAIDRVGNHSPLHDLHGSSGTLGQSKVTDIFGFEQEITKKFPGSIVLVPSEPFSIAGGVMSWDTHILYSNGVGTLMSGGSIKMRPALNEAGYEFLGPEVVINATDMVDGETYEIKTSGTTTWSSVGSSSNNVGTVFVATGPGTGTGTVKVDKYIQSIYWDPAGGYDTSTQTFKSTATGGGAEKANEVTGLESVDENVEYEQTGYYSFSVFNPASATYNLTDGGAGHPIQTSSKKDDIFGVYTTIDSTGNYAFADFFDFADDGNIVAKAVDVTKFCTHWKDNSLSENDDLVKYNNNNTGLGNPPANTIDKVRAGYGIHMPLESRGEGVPVSLGKRNPLVKPREKDVVGAIVVGQIRLKPDMTFSVTSSWHAFANAVIGTAMIGDASIKTAHVNDISADILTAGEISGQEIILGEKRTEGESVSHGSIRSKDYGGIYDQGAGFVISGDGTFSFSKEGTSLSFDDHGLVLRGTLTQPDGRPAANIRLRASADQVLVSDFQVPNQDWTPTVLSPDGGEITIYADINNAFDFKGNPLGASNIDVKVYPEDHKNAIQKSYNDLTTGGGPQTPGEVWWWHGETNDGLRVPQVDNLQGGALGDNLNDGASVSLDFGPEGGANNKFIKREYGQDAVLADYFSVEVRLKYVNNGTTGNIQWVPSVDGVPKSYRSGDFVVNGLHVYQAERGNTGVEPSGTADTDDWKYIGPGQDMVVASDIFEINQLREASDALSFQLRSNEGTVIKGSGSTLDFTPWLIYGSTASYNLTESGNDEWVKEATKNIKIFREVVADVDSFPAWTAGVGYTPGAVVKHNAKIYPCHTPPGQTATFDAGDWQEETPTEIYKGGDTEVSWEKVRTGKPEVGQSSGMEIDGNQVVRDSFGANGSVKFQNILFSMKQYTVNDDLIGTLDTVKFTLLQDGNSAGELSFYENDARTTPKYAISRPLNGDGKRDGLSAETTFFTCRFFEGATVLPEKVEGKISITTSAGNKIQKSNISVTDGSGNDYIGPGTVELSADDDADVGRITLRVKLKNANNDTICVGSEQIDIISAQPENKAFRLTLKRGFIEFDGGSEAVNNNLLSPENIVPVQLFLGAENVVSKFNANDEVDVIPNFGWVASGEALDDALKGGGSTAGRVMPSQYGSLKSAITARSIAAAIPDGDSSSNPYYIYKEGGVYKFNTISDSGNTQEELGEASSFFFYIPDNASGEEAVKKKHGLSLKATYNRPAGGLTGDDDTYEDIEEINVMEIAADGVDPFWATSDNQNLVVAASAEGNMEFATNEGKADVSVYRGNKEIFLAPKRIQISTDGTTYTTFTLSDIAGSNEHDDRTDTISKVFEYKGILSGLNSKVTHVRIGNEATGGVELAGSTAFEKTTNGNADTIRISKGGDSFHRKDNQKRHVLILNGDTVLQYGDFTLPSPWPAESKFSQTDFTAWPINADAALYCTAANGARGPLNLISGSAGVGAESQKLTSNFDLADGKILMDEDSNAVNTAGMITSVYVYDNLLGIRSKVTFERKVGMSKTGAPGPSFAYRGEYSPFKSYRGDSQRIDVVKYTNPANQSTKWYKAKQASSGVAPTDAADDQYWGSFNELQSTATDLLLAGDVFVKRGIVAGIDRDVGTQQQPSFIASQLESRYYNLSSSFDPHAMGGIQKGIDFTNNGTPISNTHPSLESYLSANPNGESPWRTTGWYLDQTDWDYYIEKTAGTPPAGTDNTDAWARNHFLTNGDDTYIRIRESVPDSATDGTRSIRSRRSQKTYKTPNDKLPGFFLGFDRIDTAVTNSSASGGADWAADDFYVPKFELRSVFGNYLYWDGNNLNIKGAIINASADDGHFSRLVAADDVLVLSGPQNPDTGGQTFVGGGFNNELTPRLDNLGSSIMGGGANKISINETAQKPRFSVIGGGYGNEIHNPFSFIGGGYLNKIGGFVPRGETAAELRSKDGVNSIVGGSKNEILYSDYCAIGTGFGNAIQDSKYSTILNGYKNAIDGGDIEKKAFLDSTGEFRWGNNGPAFDDDIEGGITGVKCTVEINGQSVDPFEWRLPFHRMDGRAGEEEVVAFYRYFMGQHHLHLTAGVKLEDVSTAWTAVGVFSRNNLVKHNNKVWVCTRTSTGDKPDENSDVWYDVTFGRKYDPDGEPRWAVLDGSGNYLANGEFYGDMVKGAMSDVRFARNGKWALDIGLNKETCYINDTGGVRERKTEYERFNLIGGDQADKLDEFDYDGKTWNKTVIPAHSNKNSAFSIFNNLGKITHLGSTLVNSGGVAGGQSVLSFAILFDTGCKVGDKKLYVRAESKHLNGALNGSSDSPRRIFDIGYYENDKFYWVPVTTSTWAWPVVYVPAFGTSKAYGLFKLGEGDEILWEPVGGDSETVDQLFTTVSFADISNSPNTSSNAFSSNLTSMYGNDSKTYNRTIHAPASTVGGAGTNLADMKPNSIVTSVPEPNADAHTESWYNTIVGGDYNKIAKSRRSTIVGGRAVSLFQVERAIVGGLGNLLIGTPSGTQLPKGFTVFGTENTISHESPDFIPHKDDPTQSNAGESYITSAGGTPSRFDALANTVFGSYNRVRNSDRMTVLGSNNDILFEDGGFKQTGSEITILGTDNKIEIDQNVDAVNLGIFGTNFTLTQPAMVQNTFYIGNPKIEDTTDLKALTRVFVAADGGMFVTGDVIAYALSDKKYKENVKLIESPLEKLLKIRGVTFDWNKDQDVYEGHDIGVLADEVEKVLPEVVENRRTGKAVRYEKLTPLLIEAVKAQQEIIDSLTARVEALESKR